MNSDDFGKDLSAEEIEVNTILDGASQQIEAIENQIKTLPRDKGYTLKLSPPGSIPSQPFGTMSEMKKKLKEDVERITNETKERAATVLKSSNPQIRQKAEEKIAQWQSPDSKENAAKKTMDQSQDYLQRKMEEGTLIPINQSKEGIEHLESTEPQSPTVKTPSAWERFDAGLSYNTMSEKDDHAPDKTDKSRSIDWLENRSDLF